MRARRSTRNRRRGATVMLLTVMLPFFLIPLVGLAIDGTMTYIVQAKLSSACDGAAIGAGRLLGTSANTIEIAGEFFNVNFPAGFWGARNVQPNITLITSLGTHTITVAATAQVPLLFLRVLRQNVATVAATATVTRRDTRIVMVLDRSGSMDTTDPVSHLNVFTTMQNSAKLFAGMFTPGADEMGLVVISGSSIVAYPTTRPYNPDPRSAGGPDTSFATSPGTGPLFTQISAVSAGGGTGMAEALSLAYIELQKAHYRDLALDGYDNRLNAIVLFTDGVPCAIAVNPNDRSSLPGSNSLKSGSSCTYNPETSSSSTQMRGWIAAPGDPPGWGSSQGLYLLSLYDTSHSLTWWLQNPASDQTTSSPSSALSGCSGLGRNGTAFNLSELRQVPPFDIYGNSTTSMGYIYSTLAYDGKTYDPTKPNVGYHMGLGAWNATDNAGRTIRAQSAMNPIAIYTIGYTGNGGTDVGLLKRLANVPASSSYDSTQMSGLFLQVASADQIGAAFQAVASELLRLSR